MRFPPPSSEEKEKSIRMLRPLYDCATQFHDYSIEGLEKIDLNKNFLVVLNHSLATYDMILFAGFLYLSTGIWLRPVADKLVFKLPLLQQLAKTFAAIPGEHSVLQEILNRGESILLAPGGMKEAIRSSQDKYTICWENRKGFIKLALSTRTPILLAACANADDIYDVKKNIVTDLCYQKFKLPLPFARGAKTLLPFIPKKIKLTHVIDGPYSPPSFSNEEDFERKVDEFHEFICNKMKDSVKRTPPITPHEKLNSKTGSPACTGMTAMYN